MRAVGVQVPVVELKAILDGMMGNKPSQRRNQTTIMTRSPVWLLGTPYPMDSLQDEVLPSHEQPRTPQTMLDRPW